MFISALKVTNFRNFERAEFTFDKDKTAICGDNARGKSNLLEAIYFLAIGKSGRGAKDREVLRWGSTYFAVDANIEREDQSFPIRIAYDSRMGSKKAFLEDHPLPRLSGLIGAFNAVLFSPEDVDLVLRDPPQRRRLLDILVSQSNASYLSDLDTYRRVLSQRNRLLKDGRARIAADSALLVPWDRQLAEIGARIIRHRMDALDEMEPRIRENYRQIARSAEDLRTVYRSLVDPAERDRAQEVLAEALHGRHREEMDLGFTLSGPHRDNLVFMLERRAAHQVASKGQMKSALLAWKLAEASFLEARTGRRPVLLLDDIFSELDPKRSASLLEMIPSFGQVVLTSARDPDLAFAAEGFRLVEL